jgi:hypothetical protein
VKFNLLEAVSNLALELAFAEAGSFSYGFETAASHSIDEHEFVRAEEDLGVLFPG